ncbi:MAG: hypothetical protein QOK21_1988 [Solirubrobacteraceae bacterium]|nr:hypothetical protein [Solirubrobacteraceae bacterium]
MADPVADAADRLYGLDLDAFTGERDRAAKALRKDDRAAAEAIGKLRKPSPPAWAANRVARERPELRDELLAAGAAVRDAQEAALAGKGRDALRAATARMRAAVDAFLDAAREQRPGDRALSAAAANRLRTTLHAAAADDAVRAGLETGRLVGDAEAGGAWPLPGAGDGDGATVKAKRAARAKEPETAPGRAATTAPPKRDREAVRREREAAERRRELESRLRSARADSTARERELARAEREADRTARRLERALADAEEARTHAEETTADAAAARTAAGEARDEVARLEEQLD